MNKLNLGLEIADCGRWEEFYQRRHEYVMYDYFKASRLNLEKIYRNL